MKFRFKEHIIDDDLPKARYAQTALADIDGDGAVSVADILLLLAAFGEEC